MHRTHIIWVTWLKISRLQLHKSHNIFLQWYHTWLLLNNIVFFVFSKLQKKPHPTLISGFKQVFRFVIWNTFFLEEMRERIILMKKLVCLLASDRFLRPDITPNLADDIFLTTFLMHYIKKKKKYCEQKCSLYVISRILVTMWILQP